MALGYKNYSYGRAANAKEETTGRTGALGFLICVLSPIDDFGEKNIMRLFVLFLD